MRGTRRGGRQLDRNHRHNRAENSCTFKPVDDHSCQHQRDRNNGGVNISEENSSSLPSTSQPLQSSGFATKSERKHWNSNYGSRNRRGRGGKRRFLRKSEADHSKPDANGTNEVNSSRYEVDELSGGVVSLSVDGNSAFERENEGREVAEMNASASSGGREVADAGQREDDALSILDELRLSGKQPELTEDQLRLNDQLQEDELLAMESIYSENVLILDRHDELRYFQIHVKIDASDALTVTANLSSHGCGDEGSDNFSSLLNVQYLPPIILTCLLPKSYPSQYPPYFTISVQWLNSQRISSLCSVLDSIWMEHQGQEVLHQWADWLQNSSISYLGFDKEIVLGPYGNGLPKDKRAVSGSLSPDIDILFIKRYDEGQRRENFLKRFHECCICFSEYAGFDFAMLPCQHFFCWKCMRIYSHIHVSEGTISKLQCPDSKCEGVVPPGLLKKLLGEEEFERWESLMLQKTLESRTDVQYCPRCETPCIEDDEQHAQCSKCFFSFCTLCRERRHVGSTCMTPEMKLKILQERQNSSHLREDQRQRERDMINEILSVKTILKDAKQCPSCKMAISRTEGCNKMVCGNCGQYFCYCCNQAITGYEHFRDGECELFPTQMIQEWEERVNARQMIGQIRAQLFPHRGQRCPNCRQVNAKVGNNNHLFCWSCRVHYCYLCKQIVRRSSQHYGPKGCKQHTEG